MRPVPDNLKKYLYRINPRVELAAEFNTVLAEDAANTKLKWEAGTQTPANSFFDAPPPGAFADGTLTLKESDILGIQNTVGTTFIENLTPDAPKSSCTGQGDAISCITPAHFAAFELGIGIYGPGARLRKFKALLSRQRVGGNPQFNGAFRLDLFTLAYYQPEGAFFFFPDRVPFRDLGQIVPIADPVYLNASDVAGGAVDDRWPLWPSSVDTQLVTFDLTDQRLRVGDLPIPEMRAREADFAPSGRLYIRPIILARISAIRGTAGVTNVGWQNDSTVHLLTAGNGQLFQFQMTDAYHSGPQGFFGPLPNAPPFYIRRPDGTDFDDQFSGMPRCEFVMAGYPTGTPDMEVQVDLGSVPASAATVEFGAIFDKPLGTSLSAEVKDSTPGFVAFTDGQTAADLGLLAEQTYQMRFVMGANTNLDTSPTGFELNCRDRTTVEVTDLVNIGPGNFAIDPRNMRAEIRQITVDVVRDGRRDFADRASRLGYELHPDDIDIALYIRAAITPVPPRNEWMLLDVFRVADQESLWGAERFTAVSILEKLKRTIPRQVETAPSSGVFLRAPIVFAAATLATVWNQLLTEAQVPARYIGQPPVGNLEDPDPDPSDPISFAPSLTKTITKTRDCKREIDRLGMILGGVTTTAFGRIVFRRMLGEKGLKRIFRHDEISVGRTPRNLPQRMIEFFSSFGYIEDSDKFTGEVRSFDGDALANLGVPTVGRRASELDVEAAKYLPDAAHARAIGAAQVTAFGGGVLFPWEFATSIPAPELETGDLIAFETDRLTLRDPISDREIKGRSFVRAIVAGSNLLGTAFTVWVRSFADIVNVGGTGGSIGDIANFAEVLTTNVVQGGTGSLKTVQRSVTVDLETRRVKVFRRRGTIAGDRDWPTKDGLQAGALSPIYFKGTIDNLDNFAFEDGGYSTSDIVRDIWIAVGFDTVDGERTEFTAYTVTGVATPRFNIDLTFRNLQSEGTACTPTNKRRVIIDWTTIDTTSAQEVRVLGRVREIFEDPPYLLKGTFDALPLTQQTVVELDVIKEDNGPIILADFKLELNDDGGSPTHQVVDLPEDDLLNAVDCRTPE